MANFDTLEIVSEEALFDGPKEKAVLINKD
jgi:hypothetical protein